MSESGSRLNHMRSERFCTLIYDPLSTPAPEYQRNRSYYAAFALFKGGDTQRAIGYLTRNNAD